MPDPRRDHRARGRPAGAAGTADGHAYLDAWCHLAEARRLFRLDRITGLEVLDEPAQEHDVPPRTCPTGLFEPGPDDLSATVRLRPRRALGGGVLPGRVADRARDGGLEVVLRGGRPAVAGAADAAAVGPTPELSGRTTCATGSATRRSGCWRRTTPPDSPTPDSRSRHGRRQPGVRVAMLFHHRRGSHAVIPLIAGLGPQELIIIVVVLVLLFGAKKLPELARGSGRALRIFKAETKGLLDDEDDDKKTPEQREIDARNEAKPYQAPPQKSDGEPQRAGRAGAPTPSADPAERRGCSRRRHRPVPGEAAEPRRRRRPDGARRPLP